MVALGRGKMSQELEWRRTLALAAVTQKHDRVSEIATGAGQICGSKGNVRRSESRQERFTAPRIAVPIPGREGGVDIRLRADPIADDLPQHGPDGQCHRELARLQRRNHRVVELDGSPRVAFSDGDACRVLAGDDLERRVLQLQRYGERLVDGPSGVGDARPVILVMTDGKDSGMIGFRQPFVSQAEVIDQVLRDLPAT